MTDMTIKLIVAGIIALLVILVLAVLASGYVKASPDQAIIISGLRKAEKKKVLIGRAGIKIPFFERKDILSLALIPIDVKTKTAVPTSDFINITVDAAVNVQIGKEPELIELAAANFLNKKSDYIRTVAAEVLEGNMREIVGQLSLRAMVSDRKVFAEKVQENASPDLRRMGLVIVSFNVQNFADQNHVIEDLGVDNVVAIQKSAAISRADSEKEIAVAQAKADKEKTEARVSADKEIAQKQNELMIRKAELQEESDIKKAKADAAYKIEEQNQRKSVEIARTEADIAKQEKEVILRQKEAEVREKSLDAEVRRTAEADKYKKQQEAEAALIEEQKKADASMYAIQKEAEARKAKADADKYEQEQRAKGIKAVGEAEADAIRAKGEAEAAAMEKKAEAYSKYNNAAVLQMVIEKLPEMAEAVAKPIAAIDKVTVIDGGNGSSGIESFGAAGPSVLAKTIEMVKETTGFDLTEIMKAATYDAKVTKNINYSGDPAVAVNAGSSVATGSSTAEGMDSSDSIDVDSKEVKGGKK